MCQQTRDAASDVQMRERKQQRARRVRADCSERSERCSLGVGRQLLLQVRLLLLVRLEGERHIAGAKAEPLLQRASETHHRVLVARLSHPQVHAVLCVTREAHNSRDVMQQEN